MKFGKKNLFVLSLVDTVARFSDGVNRCVYVFKWKGWKEEEERREIRGCLALQELTGLPLGRRVRRGVTHRIPGASHPLLPYLRVRVFFLFVSRLSIFPPSVLHSASSVLTVAPFFGRAISETHRER